LGVVFAQSISRLCHRIGRNDFYLHSNVAASSKHRRGSASYPLLACLPGDGKSAAKVVVPPRKRALADAFGYGLNQWDGLCRFLDDGRIEIDSNTVERSIRGLALTRKNALSAGHERGAADWAMIASLLETCKLNRSILWPGPPTCSPSSSIDGRHPASTN
jgi:hypothetical protein